MKKIIIIFILLADCGGVEIKHIDYGPCFLSDDELKEYCNNDMKCYNKWIETCSG